MKMKVYEGKFPPLLLNKLNTFCIDEVACWPDEHLCRVLRR